jgi:hypothetical protein
VITVSVADSLLVYAVLVLLVWSHYVVSWGKKAYSCVWRCSQQRYAVS